MLVARSRLANKKETEEVLITANETGDIQSSQSHKKLFTPRTERIISPAGSLNNLFGEGRTLIIELEKVGLEQALCESVVESVVAGDRLGTVSGIVKVSAVYLHSAHPHIHAQTITIHRDICAAHQRPPTSRKLYCC